MSRFYADLPVLTDFSAVTQAEDALDRNVSPKVVADWLAINVH